MDSNLSARLYAMPLCSQSGWLMITLLAVSDMLKSRGLCLTRLVDGCYDMRHINITNLNQSEYIYSLRLGIPVMVEITIMDVK